mgnify:CR=1 FL=1
MNVKIFILALMILGLVLIDILTDIQIKELNKKVLCLEQGKIYVGDGFCANK